MVGGGGGGVGEVIYIWSSRLLVFRFLFNSEGVEFQTVYGDLLTQRCAMYRGP
jgi:hypothetical protein